MDNKGITIIELILILAIMGIIFLIAIPKFDFSDSEMKRFGRELVMDLNYIKTKSKTSKYNFDNKIHFITSAGKKDSYYVSLKGEPNKRVYLNEKFTIATNLVDKKIYFTKIGVPSPRAGTIRLINNSNNNYIEITITPATGRIHMYEDIKKGYQDDLEYEMGTNK